MSHRGEKMDTMDRLVKLYDLPNINENIKELAEMDIIIRRPRAYEKHQVISWVENNFSNGWASECEICFSRMPVSCFIASHNSEIIGFACYETTYKNFFGPIGISEKFRNKEIGSCLLLSCLNAMHEMGYAYAIIGGPKDAANFYKKVVSAVDIEGSNPGIYIDRLSGSDS